jgi:hypothetical protein
MRVRDLMLASLGGGLLLGTMLGATTSTTMKPAPEPPWRQAAGSGAGSSQQAKVPQQDLGPTWSSEDRTPTWKRHLPENQEADYNALPLLTEPVAAPAPEVAAPQTEAERTIAPDAVAETPVEPAQAGA